MIISSLKINKITISQCKIGGIHSNNALLTCKASVLGIFPCYQLHSLACCDLHNYERITPCTKLSKECFNSSFFFCLKALCNQSYHGITSYKWKLSCLHASYSFQIHFAGVVEQDWCNKY